MSNTGVNENSLGNNNTAEVDAPKHILVKECLEQSELDGQSTSKGITSVFSGPVIVNSQEQNQILHVTDSLDELANSLDELSERILRERIELEDDDSFVTVDGSRKDITTTTEPAIIFSVNERTQNILTARNEPSNYPPPPPYDYNGSAGHQGGLARTPVYQERYIDHAPMGPQDASRAPPYRRNYEGSESVLDAFDTKRIRNKFIQKVFMILSAQLLFTFGVIGLATFDERVKIFILTHNIFTILALGVYILTIIILFCYDESRRIFPLNFILLSFLTAAMAYTMAAITCAYSTQIVLVTFGVTTAVCILVTLIACQSWFDVTECGMVLFLASLILLIYGIIATFVTIYTGSNTTYLIYACLMTLLFCMYMMYDTQEILGGRRIELSPEEYILGALTLYIDFMMLFQQLLYIIATANN